MVWREADTPAEVALPLRWWQVKEARSHLGTPLPIGQGEVRLTVGRAAVYLILPAGALRGKLSRQAPPLPAAWERGSGGEGSSPRQAPPLPAAWERGSGGEGPALHSIVVRLRVDGARVDKSADAYVVAPGAEATAQAEVYNFGDTPFRGEARVACPAGWTADRTRIPAEVAPGERAVIPLRLRAPEQFERAGISLIAETGSKESAPAAVHLQVDANRAKARASRPLPLEKPEAWERNIAGHGSMEIAAGAEGGVRFAFTFRASGDNWAYPQARFQPPLDLSDFSALRFEYRTSVADSGPVRVMLVEDQGVAYFTANGLPGSTEWRSATVPFSALTPMGADSDGRLDLGRIALIRIGANSKPQQLVLEVRGVQAVRL